MMEYLTPPIGTEDDTYHWIMCRHDGSMHIGLYTNDGWHRDGWNIPGFLYDISPLPSSVWEYKKPVVPYDATP